MSYDKPLVNFVRAKETVTDEFIKQNASKNDVQGTLTGDEAKEFYQNITSTSCEANLRDTCTRSKPVETKKVTRDATKLPKRRVASSAPRRNERLVNKYLQCAQEGDLDEIKKLISDSKIDIDSSDQFSWTALMCAAHSGQTHIVRYLLKKGAECRLLNKQSQSAIDLARLAKHSSIVSLLKSMDSNSDRMMTRSLGSHSRSEPFWCTVCQLELTEDKKRHSSSTVHQFNCQHKPKRPYYSIREDNPGYKLMVKSGWDEEKGLGPEGDGRQYPVKTVLKRDRYGLGSDRSSKPRVTHFGANDESAVKRTRETHTRKLSSRALSKKQKRMKESKEKTWERNMRIYMSS